MGKAWRALAQRLAGKAKLALILPLSLAMAATATADTVPQVTLATPGSSGTGDGTITRFTLRFSEDMVPLGDPRAPAPARSEEHTSELQSLMRISYAVFCLKKKNTTTKTG